MKDYYRVIIGGEAGYGVMTSGSLLSKLAASSGLHVFDYVEYPSLIRGGHNAYEAVFSRSPISDLVGEVDLLVCFNKDTYDRHKDELGSGAIVMYDPDEFDLEAHNHVLVPVPFRSILKEGNGSFMMKNTVLMGALSAILSADINWMYASLEKQFGKKGKAIVELNKKFVKQGYDYAQKQAGDKAIPLLSSETKDSAQLIMTGNDAFSLGCVIAGCQLYAAYPMTPASSVLATLAAWQEKAGMIVRHSEDEIAVINTALGASFAGVRSAVGTSGGGFALMTESVSLAGITETPLVIFLSQRPGPATGLPTWTEQGDLLFAVHAGHGEFPKIVLAPGDNEEMIALTTRAFDLADVYQTPVIVLSDMLLSEHHSTIARETVTSFANKYKPNRGKLITTADANYLRYGPSEDGISKRLVPGQKGVYFQANSYTHSSDGHTSELSKDRIEQVDKRAAKMSTYIKNDFLLPHMSEDIEKKKTVLVSWGGAKGAVKQAIRLLGTEGEHVGHMHFHHLYPLSEEKIKPLFADGVRYVLVENNSQAQFGQLLRQQTGVHLSERLLKYNGRPIHAEEIIQFIQKS